MNDVIKLCKVKINGDITGSVEKLIEFFEDLKKTYDILLRERILKERIFWELGPDSIIEHLCLSEPDDSPIKIYPLKDEEGTTIDSNAPIFFDDSELKKIEKEALKSAYEVQLLTIVSDNEKGKILDEKLDALVDNHSLMVKSLKYSSDGYLLILGVAPVLIEIVRFIIEIKKAIDQRDYQKQKEDYYQAKKDYYQEKTKETSLMTVKHQKEIEKLEAETQLIDTLKKHFDSRHITNAEIIN